MAPSEPVTEVGLEASAWEAQFEQFLAGNSTLGEELAINAPEKFVEAGFAAMEAGDTRAFPQITTVMSLPVHRERFRAMMAEQIKIHEAQIAAYRESNAGLRSALRASLNGDEALENKLLSLQRRADNAANIEAELRGANAELLLVQQNRTRSRNIMLLCATVGISFLPVTAFISLNVGKTRGKAEQALKVELLEAMAADRFGHDIRPRDKVSGRSGPMLTKLKQVDGHLITFFVWEVNEHNAPDENGEKNRLRRYRVVCDEPQTRSSRELEELEISILAAMCKEAMELDRDTHIKNDGHEIVRTFDVSDEHNGQIAKDIDIGIAVSDSGYRYK